MKILFAVSEAVPFIKTGGLADVAGSLPAALGKLGHEVRIFLPFYSQIPKDKLKLLYGHFAIEISGVFYDCSVYEKKINKCFSISFLPC